MIDDEIKEWLMKAESDFKVIEPRTLWRESIV